MDTKEKLSKIRLDPSEKVRQAGNGAPGTWLKAPFLVLGAIALAVALLLWFSSGDDEIAATEEAASGVAGPPTLTSSSSGDRILSAGGYVEARRTALVWPGREGIVAEVHVVRGQEVEKGQVLLELDARAPAAALDMSKAELEEARAVLARVLEGSREEELAAARAEVEEAEVLLAEAQVERDRILQLENSGLVTAAEVDRARFRADAAAARLETLRSRERLAQEGNRPSEIAEAEADVARKEAAVRAAEVDLDLTRVRAPFTGRVIGIELEPGEVVSLFDVRSGVEIADESELWVRVDVPENRLGGLQIGDQAQVIAQAIGSERLSARVVEIAPKADRQSNTVEVAVAVDDPPPLLRPDMSARVEITVAGGSE